MKKFLSILLFLLSFSATAQNTITGTVASEKLEPLAYATVALLHPDDSTLAFFGITNTDGSFEIKSVVDGNYILQSAFIGYKTFHKNVQVPLQDGNAMGTIVMKEQSVNMGAVDISSERIPMLIKKDTIEYDAGAFKTKPDAATEDLLKKLPGVEVDRNGNIKAQGEDVRNVLVDGKEFFSSDPTVATKNLPADAVKKVQVYDKKSDEAELTGIDDGSRNKTINLLLKDNKKSAWMGDAQVGTGTGSHYQSSAKAYRFTKQTQFAALGMLNNINKFGFSFRDYMDFNGGMQSIMNGGGMRLGSDDENTLPINFGQPTTGLITSGAGGLNYTYEKKKDNRFNISYLGNGSNKKLKEDTYTQNFTPGNSFTQNENLDQTIINNAHRFNFGFRNKPDSTQNLITSGNAGFTNGNNNANSASQSFSGNNLENSLIGNSLNSGNGISATIHAAYFKKGYNKIKLFKVAADGSASRSLKNNEWNNLTQYYMTGNTFIDARTQKNKQNAFNYSLTASATFKAGKQFYMVPEIKAGINTQSLHNQQRLPTANDAIIDSLSPHFKSGYQWLRTGISFRRSNQRSQLNITARAETGQTTNTLNNEQKTSQNIFYFTPMFSWDYEYKPSRHVSAYYESSVQNAFINQLLPVPDNSNPVILTTGNNNLRPEYIHNAQLNWVLFDQFSFTSVFASLRGSYTHDKINWARTIGNNLSQQLTLTNVPDDYSATADIEFTTPIRSLGINLHIQPSETWNRAISPVNGIANTNTNFNHAITLSIDNRKKEKLDLSIGSTVLYTTARYSLQGELNTNYVSLTGFAEGSYAPNSSISLTASADITQYHTGSFAQSIYVPLLKASVTYYFLKASRASLTLEAFDILNKNTGLQRITELNYLRQKHSNIIGRYVLLSFKYRLNKFDGGGGDVNLKVNGR